MAHNPCRNENIVLCFEGKPIRSSTMIDLDTNSSKPTCNAVTQMINRFPIFITQRALIGDIKFKTMITQIINNQNPTFHNLPHEDFHFWGILALQPTPPPRHQPHNDILKSS